MREKRQQHKNTHVVRVDQEVYDFIVFHRKDRNESISEIIRRLLVRKEK